MEKEEHIKWFSDIRKSDLNFVGKKAYYLSVLHNAGSLGRNVFVPEGFVILKKDILEFFEKHGIYSAIKNILEEVNFDDILEVERASKQIIELIKKAHFSDKIQEEILEAYETLGMNKDEIEKGSAFEILATSTEPVFVAVRSSDDKNFGESYFNVKLNSSVVSAIKKVLSSFFEPMKLLKYKKNNYSVSEVLGAVLIQKMVQSDKSGEVCLGDDLKVYGLWGMGSGLKQKEIGKDEYFVRRDSKVLEKKIVEKNYAISRDSAGNLRPIKLREEYSSLQVLNESELSELSDVSLRIETLFEKRMKFDFAIENNEIFIVKIEDFNDKFEVKRKNNEEIEEINEVKKEVQPFVLHKEESQTEPVKREVSPPESITKTKIDLIISNRAESENAKYTLLKKAGLIKVEDIFYNRKVSPLSYLENYNMKEYEKLLSSELFEYTKNLEEAWVRLSNFSSDKFLDLDSKFKKEKNPLLGLKGIRFLLKYPELLRKELSAINSLNSKLSSVGVLIPMISSVYELKKVKEIIEKSNFNIKLGVVLETPASIQLVKDFALEKVDYVLFSGNMLSQYLLAMDKKNPELEEFFDLTSPALMYQIEYVIRVCNRNKIPISFYGDSLLENEMVGFLIKNGISSLLTKPLFVNELSKKIISAEEKYIVGTDKEIRQYDFNRERARQKKEIVSFEKMKEARIHEEIDGISKKSPLKEKLNEVSKSQDKDTQKDQKEMQKEITVSEMKLKEIKENIEAIEEEKKEYLKEENNPEKDLIQNEEENNKKEDNSDEELIDEDIIETKLDYPGRENNSSESSLKEKDSTDDFTKELEEEQNKIKVNENEAEDPLGILS